MKKLNQKGFTLIEMM
ncbi:prepilin-type N-terminal cleavage/methylation domain-containing protein [Turicibacter sanguinis]|nr:prepilin-type N-terminal cleavage/methylation domain-containing protein [Turicibacter sanguinis]MTN51412.1 prepilin-type N-terminal cleavage/methylation domain-containing protein [Turicibacter sanguinis]MTN54599.1 prepilin-type N-terminal cleavage/methylation domain-containing protein [Turicibacter sanguinis]MTN57732.1 prepilin-type N-terminal cleavage/methylation domain-containing protein [Turicibacter sanguinis]MTN60758.1 prepilin-type N-terminal cleavage/methylation domain-containing prot